MHTTERGLNDHVEEVAIFAKKSIKRYISTETEVHVMYLFSILADIETGQKLGNDTWLRTQWKYCIEILNISKLKTNN